MSRRWLERNAKALQGLSAIVMMALAAATLIGVKLQIDATASQQREQSARDIYREFLNLSISKPEFADPDHCAIEQGPEAGAYENYVEYMLYTADQLLSVSPVWRATMMEHMAAHSGALCGAQDWSDDSAAIQSLVADFRSAHCDAARPDCAR